MKLCRIKQQVSTAYHLETNGETEQVNRELEVYLRILCKWIPEDWDKHLPIAEFSYNGQPHSTLLAIYWKFTMKCPELQLKNYNKMPRATIEKSQWNTRLQLKNCNEIPRAAIEKSKWNTTGYNWNTPGQNWKITMKCPGLQLKNCNEIPRAAIEKSHWNAQGYNWQITMKYPRLKLKNRNEMPRATIEKS